MPVQPPPDAGDKLRDIRSLDDIALLVLRWLPGSPSS